MTTPASLSRRAFVSGLAPAILRAKPKPPNVIFFMSDDHGAWANGVYGCPSIHTPNIDGLARHGTRFTSAYAATPVCSPSRITWLTGLLPSRHGVQDYLLPADSFGPSSRRWLQGLQTYPELLARNGYTCGLTGKWHMGMDDTPQSGFSYWATVPGGSGPYKDAEFVVNGARRRMPGFKEDAIGDFALDFVGQNKDRPFFLLAPFYAPHTPYDFQPPEDRAPYAASTFGCFPDPPPHPNQNASLARHHRNPASKLAYSALVTAMDRNVGRVLARLDELRLRRDTLVVFSADQGWNAGHHGVWGKGNGTVPYNMYEESVRVPLVWSLPGRIPEGRSSAGLTSSYDFSATLLNFLGLGARSTASPRYPRRDALYFEYAYVRASRDARFKYVERAAPWPSELYDLASDPGESRNLIADPALSRTRETLASRLQRFFHQAGAPPLADWRSTTRQLLPSEHIIR